ncbi:MAG: transposase [Chitinophagales bacterium]
MIVFHTATCLNWQLLLAKNNRKQIILDSLQFLCNDNRIYLIAFVIMPNHIHWIWEKREDWRDKNVKQMFLKYTAQQIKFDLDETELLLYRSTQADRNYHFWERRSWKAEMTNRKVLEQKLNYIHNNPVKANLVSYQEDYLFSSASFYAQKERAWNFITHYMDRI